jgi:hypothetical protein
MKSWSVSARSVAGSRALGKAEAGRLVGTVGGAMAGACVSRGGG